MKKKIFIQTFSQLAKHLDISLEKQAAINQILDDGDNSDILVEIKLTRLLGSKDAKRVIRFFNTYGGIVIRK